MSDWQDIASAPKGTKLIAGYLNQAGKWRSVMATYYEAGTLDAHDSIETEDGLAAAGWYEESETHECLMPIDRDPTSWQPLPAPPKGLERQGE